MWYLGLDVHRRSITLAGVNNEGTPLASRSFPCEDPTALLAAVQGHQPYHAVIEACGSYHWIYALLQKGGEVTLAHPYKLRALWTARAKTDKLDAIRLAQLLRAGLIPAAYVPPPPYQQLRDWVRSRVRVVRDRAEVYHHLHSILARFNWHSPYAQPFCKRGVAWLRTLDLPSPFDCIRQELLERLTHYDQAIQHMDEQLDSLAADYPQIEALTAIYGIGTFSALLIVAELGEVERFNREEEIAAYAGLTPKVHQSGSQDYHGAISKSGSPWLRWILVEASIKVIRKDPALRAFHQRVRRRSGWRRARVAVARKLAVICWKRLRAWERQRPAA